MKYFLLFVALSHPDEFFNKIGDHFSDKFNDDRIKDLTDYLKATTIHINYKSGQQHQFNHNWYEYVNGTQDLVSEPRSYQINDSTIRVGQAIEEIDWEQYKGTPDYLTHFFYRVCYHIMSRKTVSEIQPI